MHGMLCFAGQNVSRKMNGGLPREGCGTCSARGGSCSDRPRCGTADFHKLKLDLKGVSHESFVFISSTFLFERNHESFASHDSFVFTS